jgi:hypothetical protein
MRSRWMSLFVLLVSFAFALAVQAQSISRLQSMASLPSRPASQVKVRSRRHFSRLGPQAIPADVAGPGYGFFSCQVGLSVGACYDPYQMRHAYGVDTLINAGLTGRGKTIVIVDAYQSPNIVQQLNHYNSFYGLPSLNGLGGAPDASLGTFTQVAPDGLTPFVTGDPNMTGWAEEISLDVRWALSPPVLTSCWSWQNRTMMPTF